VATENEFDLFSGDDYVLHFTIVDEAGVAVDLSGAQQITFALARKVSVEPLFSKTLGSGVTVTDGPAGKVDVAIDAADTDALKGAYYHEVELRNAAGKRSTVSYGAVTIQEDLIRPA
jgi:hypothetical protein